MYKFNLSDKYMPISVKYWTGSEFETIYEMDFHRNPGKTLHTLIRDYVHELRVDDYKYRSYEIRFGSNTWVHIWGYVGDIYRSVGVLVSRKTGYNYFKGGPTFDSKYLVNEMTKR